MGGSVLRCTAPSPIGYANALRLPLRLSASRAANWFCLQAMPQIPHPDCQPNRQ